MTSNIIAYLKNPTTTEQNVIYQQISARGPRTNNLGTLLRVGSPVSGGTNVGITLDSAKPIDVGTLVNLKNRRISGFPDFIMDWVQRQTQEITTALLTPPTLTIMTPSSIGANTHLGSSMTGFLPNFSQASASQLVSDLSTQMATASQNTNLIPSLQNKTQAL